MFFIVFFISFLQFQLKFHHTLWSCYFSFHLYMLLLSNSYPTCVTSVKVNGIGSHALGRLSFGAGGGVGGGAEGTQQRSSAPPFIYHFSRKRYPFRIPSTDKWYSFHIPCLELCIPLNYRKCTAFCAGINHKNRTFSRLFQTMKCTC